MWYKFDVAFKYEKEVYDIYLSFRILDSSKWWSLMPHWNAIEN